jgi:hypothetical protein
MRTSVTSSSDSPGASSDYTGASSDYTGASSDYTRFSCAFSVSILTGIIMILVGTIMNAGLWLALVPPAVAVVGLVLFLALKSPRFGIALLFVISNLVIIGRDCGIMLFFLLFSMNWMVLVTQWLGLLAFFLKVLYYRKKATIVEVKVHERHMQPVTEDGNRNSDSCQWIGDFDLPLLEQPKPQDSKTVEEKPEVCYQVRRFRKKFYVPIRLYRESAMDAYVLPTRPKEAILVQLSEIEEIILLIAVLSVIVIICGIPGVLVPIQNFFTTGGDIDFEPFECDSRGTTRLSYGAMMASVPLLIVSLCQNDSDYLSYLVKERWQWPCECEALDIETHEQELPELGKAGDHDKPLTETMAEFA